jgi:hypothetical protein
MRGIQQSNITIEPAPTGVTEHVPVLARISFPIADPERRIASVDPHPYLHCIRM